MTAPDRILRAPCGCRLLVTAAGEWALQAPCSPAQWASFEHQVEAARAAGLSVAGVAP